MLIKAIKSRTVWMAIAGLVLALLQEFQGLFSPETFSIVMTAVTVIITYFKLNPSQKY